MTDLVRTLRARLEERDPLDVSADLTLEHGGETVRIESYTDHVVVSLSSLSLAAGLLGRHATRAGEVATLLAAADLSAEVRVGRRRLARLGAGVAPGPLERSLGLGPVRLRPAALLYLALD